MIVDDHADMRRTLHNYVALSIKEPLEIFDYESGEQALENYKVHMPDFVLMDIELKTMSGSVVTEEILKKNPQAKVVIITSYDTPGFRSKAKRIGAIGFIAKDNLSKIQPFLNSQTNN